METLLLTAAEITPAVTTTDYRVIYLLMDFEQSSLVIHLRGTNGERREFRYEKETAITLMLALNKLNLSTKSLQRRILERLVADGHLAGTISGAPD